MKTCSLAEQTIRHPSGLRTMQNTWAGVRTIQRHTVEMPADCCPVSHNPRTGSALTLRYVPAASVLEVYSLQALLLRFRGGFPGAVSYPPERNMEGMVQLICQMAADALGVPVRARANLILDTGRLRLTVEAKPL